MTALPARSRPPAGPPEMTGAGESSVAGLRWGLPVTPMVMVPVAYRGRRVRLGLKLEGCNPSGSVKDRTAAGLLTALRRRGGLPAGATVVESTSGNLGLALARLLTGTGCGFVAVVDPRTPESTRVRLREAGAEVVLVEAPDNRGGYLLNRLAAVRRLCAANPGWRWTNQYENRANPEIHRLTTGPELAAQAGAGLHTVFVAVSTGGTLAGVARHLRVEWPAVRLVAVDARGSVAAGISLGRRLVPGIGASRRSTFLTPASFDRLAHVADSDAVAVCRLLREDTGLCLGGSSGSVIGAALDELAAGPLRGLAVCLCPDGGDRYLESFYAEDWLRHCGAYDEVARAADRLRQDGLSFGLPQETR